MLQYGMILFVISGFVVFSSDRLFRSGKITSLKTLLKIKGAGLLVSIIATILMIYGK